MINFKQYVTIETNSAHNKAYSCWTRDLAYALFWVQFSVFRKQNENDTIKMIFKTVCQEKMEIEGKRRRKNEN